MQELLLLTAFFSMAWGPTCETESAHLINASGCAHGDAAVTPADLRCSGAPLDVCRARPNSGEEAGPPGCGATKHQGAALDMLRHRSSAGRTGHLQRGGRAYGLRRMPGVPRTDGDVRREAHAGIPFFNRTICLWNSGVRRTCEPCVRERLGAACNDDYTASHERLQSHVMRGGSQI